MFLHNTLKGQTIPLSFSIVGIKRTLVISDLQVIFTEKSYQFIEQSSKKRGLLSASVKRNTENHKVVFFQSLWEI